MWVSGRRLLTETEMACGPDVDPCCSAAFKSKSNSYRMFETWAVLH